MQQIGLQSGLQATAHGSRKPGIIPWLLVLACIAALAYLLPRQLEAIHQDVDFGVRSLLANTDAKSIAVDIDGRDVTLHGNVSPKFERDWFVQQVGTLEQVRVVADDMQEHDPREEARRARLEFQNAIRQIDTSSIRFEPSSAAFSSGSDVALGQLVALLKKYPQRRIKVAGHTDTSGRRQVNLELSRQRAAAVTDYLAARGIPRQQLLAQGYGSSQPLASNDTEVGRARNRRIELIVMN